MCTRVHGTANLHKRTHTCLLRQKACAEPSPKLLQMTVQSAKRISMTPELIEGTAEALPLDDCSIDTVVTTSTIAASRTLRRPFAKCAASSNPMAVYCLSNTGLPRSRAYGGGKIISHRCGSAVPADAISTDRLPISFRVLASTLNISTRLIWAGRSR
jgi:hypothetical protein